jgi:hypothetical protein
MWWCVESQAQLSAYQWLLARASVRVNYMCTAHIQNSLFPAFIQGVPRPIEWPMASQRVTFFLIFIFVHLWEISPFNFLDNQTCTSSIQ